jgi:putative RecB family exonuclease
MTNITKLSVSKTKTFLSCAKQYNFIYNLHLPKKDWSFHTFGKALHMALELLHKELIDKSQEPLHILMSRAYRATLNMYQSKMTKDAIEEVKTILDNYLQKITSDRITATSVSEVEKNFSIPITDRVVINGMIDRIQTDPDGILHIADYKTSKSDKYLAKDWQQLLTYAFAIAHDKPEIQKVRGSYIMLRHNFKYITKEFSRDEIMSVKGQYAKYAEQIEQETEWKANPTVLCSYCDFLNLCDEGKAFANKNIKTGEVSW